MKRKINPAAKRVKVRLSWFLHMAGSVTRDGLNLAGRVARPEELPKGVGRVDGAMHALREFLRACHPNHPRQGFLNHA